MSEKTELKTSSVPVKIQMLCIGIAGLVLLLFATSLFRAFDDFVSFDASGLTRFIRWIVVIVVVLALFTAYKNSKKTSYFITKDSLIIERGYFGAKQKNIYDIGHVTGINMNQSALGARMGYGTVVLDLSIMTKAKKIKLSGVENPEQVVATIRTALKK